MGRAIVVGAGIGGVTVANALGQGGWQVVLLERAAKLGEVGAGISVWHAAMSVLDGLGVAERLRGDTVLAGQAGLRRPDGRWLVAVRAESIRVPAMIHRARLHEAIAAGLSDAVEVRTGVTVTGLGRDEGSATVLTADGDEIAGDLVIGADGLRSVVRSTLHPGRAEPRYSGYTAYRGIAPAGAGADLGGETWGPGQRFGHVPLVDGRIYWYATANVPEGARVDDRHGEVSRLFGDWHDPIPGLLAATEPETVLLNDVYDLDLPLVPFGTGRVALLGDAAHAMTPNMGQGACSAIEDAGALARLLAERDDVPAALSAYDAERRPRTAKLIRRSRTIGRLGQLENRAALAARDSVLRTIGLTAGLLTRR